MISECEIPHSARALSTCKVTQELRVPLVKQLAFDVAY